jgi:hypothetical protein
MSTTTEVISHWSTLIENFNTSPQRFYDSVAAAIQRRQIPNAAIDKIYFKETHLLSAKREYLRIRCKNDFYFAVCAAPFGTGFFVSYWLLQPPDGCLSQLFAPLPFLSLLAKAMVKPWTYYRADTLSMFQTATHQAVMEVLDELVKGGSIKALPDADRKPVMREFFQTA